MNYKKITRDILVRLAVWIVIVGTLGLISRLLHTTVDAPTATELAVRSVNGSAQPAQAYHTLRGYSDFFFIGLTFVITYFLFNPLTQRDYSTKSSIKPSRK